MPEEQDIRRVFGKEIIVMLRPSIFRNDFMDDFFEDWFPARTTTWSKPANNLMKTDVKDLGDSYQLEMEMPGVAKENIQAELKDGYLIVTAEQTTSNDEKDEKGTYIRRERYTGKSQRSFYVGDHVTQEDMKAEFKDGILFLNFPKKESKPEVDTRKFIEIQ